MTHRSSVLRPHPRALVSLLALGALALASHAFAAALEQETVLSAVPLFPERSLAMGNDGTPHLVFSDATLRYATREREEWRFESILAEGQAGVGYIALDAHDRPSVFFVDFSFRPQYAERSDAGWTTEFIDRRAEAIPLALEVDREGRPHVIWTTGASSTYGPYRLFYAVREGDTWSVEPVAGEDGTAIMTGDADLALDRQGRPVIAYTGFGGAGLARPAGAEGAWTFEAIPVSGVTIGLALRSNDSPVVVVDTRPGFEILSQERGTWVTETVFPKRFGGVTGFGLDGAGRPAFSVRELGVPGGGLSDPGLARSARDGWIFEAVDATTGEVPLAILPSGKASILFATQEVENGPQDLVLASDTGGRSSVASAPALRLDVVSAEASVMRLELASNGGRVRFAEARDASVAWFDVRGRRVAAEASRSYAAGEHALQAPSGIASAGLYFVRVRTTLGESAVGRVFLGGSR